MTAKVIVIASGNRGKLQEFSELLAPYSVTIAPQSQFTNVGAEETGDTFVENALLKARHAAQVSGLPAIADDSGIEVDALHGAPGVYSARYSGVNATDEDNNRKLLAALSEWPAEKRTARFRCALAYVRNAADPQPLIALGTWEGRILHAPQGQNGFGYDSIFLPLDGTQSAAQMSREAKNRSSHRAQALREMMQLLITHREFE